MVISYCTQSYQLNLLLSISFPKLQTGETSYCCSCTIIYHVNWYLRFPCTALSKFCIFTGNFGGIIAFNYPPWQNKASANITQLPILAVYQLKQLVLFCGCKLPFKVISIIHLSFKVFFGNCKPAKF